MIDQERGGSKSDDTGAKVRKETGLGKKFDAEVQRDKNKCNEGKADGFCAACPAVKSR